MDRHVGRDPDGEVHAKRADAIVKAVAFHDRYRMFGVHLMDHIHQLPDQPGISLRLTGGIIFRP